MPECCLSSDICDQLPCFSELVNGACLWSNNYWKINKPCLSLCMSLRLRDSHHMSTTVKEDCQPMSEWIIPVLRNLCIQLNYLVVEDDRNGIVIVFCKVIVIVTINCHLLRSSAKVVALVCAILTAVVVSWLRPVRVHMVLMLMWFLKMIRLFFDVRSAASLFSFLAIRNYVLVLLVLFCAYELWFFGYL